MKAKNRKRPGLVWLIFLYYLLTVVPGAALLIWFLQKAPDSVQARSAIDMLTPLDWTFTGLKMVFELSAAIALFGLRRAAYPLFVGGLCVSIIQTAMQRGSLFSRTDSHSMQILAFSAIDLLACLYARSLRSRSVLI